MQKTASEHGFGKVWPRWQPVRNRRLTKIILVMKLTAALLLAALFQVKAAAVAQSVTFNGQKTTIRKVLRDVQRQTGYFVFFSSKSIVQAAETREVSVRAENMPLHDFLGKLLQGQGMNFEISDNTINITPGKLPQLSAQNAPTPTLAISGRVTDLEGNPLDAASVSIMSKPSGQMADRQGRFKIDNVQDGDLVVFSSVGYSPAGVRMRGTTPVFEQMTVQVNGRPEETEGNGKSSLVVNGDGTITVRLARLIRNIETVVVTGLFQRSASNFTGASKTISGAEAKKVSANNVFAAISALDPSFRIVPNNVTGGSINQLPEIQMRGQNSFPNLSGELSNNPNAPLFILDGFEVSLQRIVDLDMNLINSITLLKDASATAIYGSRGANGVMVVTTITPKPGKIQVTFNNDFRFTTPDLSVYNLLNTQEKLDFEKRAGVYTSESAQTQHARDVLYNERYKAMKSGVNTDWLSIPVQNGYSNRSSLYLQGGDQSIRYGIQIMADLQNGVMKGQDRKNYSGQFDLSYLMKKVQFKNSIRLFQNKANESPYGEFSEYVRLNPYWAPYDENGRPKKLLEDVLIHRLNNTYSRIPSPLYDATLNSVNSSEYFGISNNFQVRYMPTPDFYIESSFSLNKQSAGADQFFSAQDSRFDAVTDLNQKGSYIVRDEDSHSYESLTTANYNLTTGRHQLFSTLGLNFSSSTNKYYSMVTQGFPYDQLDNLLFAAQYEANGRPTGDESTVRRLGVVFSGSYSYDNRFLLDLSARRDGSSQYGADKRYGAFWSAGAGWNLHNENWFSTSDIVNRLKVRASYGTTGSLNIPAYSARSRYSFGVGTSYYGELGATLIGLGNDFLSWQNVHKANVGLDAVLFMERLDIRIDLYKENTKNALTQITLAPSTGFSSFSENLGEIENTGIEFSARMKLIENKSKGLLWSVNVNGFSNRNILKKLSNKLKASNDKLNAGNEEQQAPNVLFEEGQSINAIYVVRSLGVDPATGSEVFLKRNGEKTYEWNAADKVAYGVSIPEWNGNFGTNLLYQGFEMNLIFNYQFGGQLYNQTLIDRVESVDPSWNVDRRAYDLGWSGPGDHSKYTRIGVSTRPTRLTSRFVQDDNNLTLTSASFGYNFYRSAFVRRLGFRSLQVTAITNDLFRLSTIEIERGTSNPFARTYSLSLRVGL